MPSPGLPLVGPAACQRIGPPLRSTPFFPWKSLRKQHERALVFERGASSIFRKAAADGRMKMRGRSRVKRDIVTNGKPPTTEFTMLTAPFSMGFFLGGGDWHPFPQN